jgi:branched-chain amino acid transport system substrate-binding protein
LTCIKEYPVEGGGGLDRTSLRQESHELASRRIDKSRACKYHRRTSVLGQEARDPADGAEAGKLKRRTASSDAMAVDSKGEEVLRRSHRRQAACGLLCAGALAVGCLASESARADDVKIGLLFGITGPVANFVPPLLDAAKLAVDEVNGNGGILKGQELQTIVADTAGTSAGSIEAATKLVRDENVAAVVGPLTSDDLLAVAHKVTVPDGVLMISPSATAPVLTTLEDKDFVFRVVPSDADQGWMLARLTYKQGFTTVAVTYVDNDYGSGINDTFRDNFENYHGTVTTALAHEPNKTSYVPELQQLAQYNPQALVLIDFATGGGITIIREALEHGFFKQFIGTDSLMDIALIKEVGADKLQGIFFTAPAIDHGTSPAQKFDAMYKAAFKTVEDKLFAAQTYDAVMLVALAIEKAGTTDHRKVRDALREVCCAPGEVIEPGDWAKAKADIAAGKKINYEGASGSNDFDENGDVSGVYGHYVIENGTFKQVEVLKPE